jgi:hypothetical protein
VLATTLVPAPIAAQDAPPGPIDPTEPALLVGTTRSGTSRLLRIPLDGQNTPQVLLEQPVDQATEAPTWSVSPDGRHVLFIRDEGTEVFLVDLHNGDVRRPATVGRFAPTEQRPIWSGDGRHAAIPGESWTVIDTETGATTHLTTDQTVHGFDAAGRLILATADASTGGDPTWAFERWDPATPTALPIPIALADAVVPLAAPSQVSTTRRVTVGEVQPAEGRSGLGLQSLDDGSVRRLDGLPNGYGRAVFDPTGRLAVAIVRDQVFFAAPDQPALAVDPAHADDDWFVDEHRVWFSPTSALAAFQNAYGDPMATVHEVATGRTIFVPLPADVATAELVGVTGTQPLPLLAVARPVEPARPAEVTTGEVVASSPLVVSRRIDRPAVGPATLSVAFGRPASGGAVKTLEAHDFPIPLGSDQRPVETDIVPGPGPDTITVTTGWADERTAWTWRRGQDPRPLDLPKPFRRANRLAWSPDGRLLAGRLRYTDSVVALWRPADGTSWFLPIPTRWRGGSTEGFTEDGRSLIISPPRCSDDCGDTFPDRAIALPIDGGEADSIPPRGWSAWDSEGPRLQLRSWSGRPDPVTLRLPRGLTTARSWAVAATVDEPSLWVFATDEGQKLLLRYDRPWLGVRAPARLPLPEEVEAIDGLRPGWVTLIGERTLDCPAREALARPGAGIFWIGSCRSLAFTLP